MLSPWDSCRKHRFCFFIVLPGVVLLTWLPVFFLLLLGERKNACHVSGCVWGSGCFFSAPRGLSVRLRVVGPLIDVSVGRLPYWSIGLSGDLSVDRSVIHGLLLGWSFGLLVGRSVGRSTDRSVVRSIGWCVGRFVGLLIGRSVVARYSLFMRGRAYVCVRACG